MAWIAGFLLALACKAGAAPIRGVAAPIEGAPPVIPYSVRPDVLALPAQPLASPDGLWAQSQVGAVETVAQIVELYPQHSIYFLGRDMEYVHDTARVLLKGSPEQGLIRLINVSQSNAQDPHLRDYLEQEGLGAVADGARRPAVLVDTGFRGSIVRAINEVLPPEAQARAKLMASAFNAPSTRVFVRGLDPHSPNSYLMDLEPPLEIDHPRVREYEALPHYTPRAVAFARVEGRWEAVSGLDPRVDHGISDPERAARMMSEARAYAEKPETLERFARLRELWRDWAGSKTVEELIKKLDAQLSADRRFGWARVADFIESLRYPAAVESSLRAPAAVKKLEIWLYAQDSPRKAFRELIAKTDWESLRQLLQDSSSPEVLSSAIAALSAYPSVNTAAFVKELIERDDGNLRQPLELYIHSRPEWKKILAPRPGWFRKRF